MELDNFILNIEAINGAKYWFINNYLHRIDGPAVEFADGYIEWWLNGRYYGKKRPENWNELINRKSINNFVVKSQI